MTAQSRAKVETIASLPGVDSDEVLQAREHGVSSNALFIRAFKKYILRHEDEEEASLSLTLHIVKPEENLGDSSTIVTLSLSQILEAYIFDFRGKRMTDRSIRATMLILEYCRRPTLSEATLTVKDLMMVLCEYRAFSGEAVLFHPLSHRELDWEALLVDVINDLSDTATYEGRQVPPFLLGHPNSVFDFIKSTSETSDGENSTFSALQDESEHLMSHTAAAASPSGLTRVWNGVAKGISWARSYIGIMSESAKVATRRNQSQK